jgi:hypothetical protein
VSCRDVPLIGSRPLQPRAGDSIHLPLRITGTPIGAATPMTIRVYDVRGRLVAEQIGATQSTESGTWQWDGRDARHRPVPSGLYFVRVAIGDLADEVRRIHVLR